MMHYVVGGQLEFIEVEFEEVADDSLCAMHEGRVHHDFNHICDISINAVEHLLEHCDGLEGQELFLLVFLVLEGSAPDQKPAKEDTRLEEGLVILRLNSSSSLDDLVHVINPHYALQVLLLA